MAVANEWTFNINHRFSDLAKNLQEKEMANAEIYARYKTKGGGWSGPFGTGESTMLQHQRGVDNSDSHAERQAWREAIDKNNKSNIDSWFDKTKAGFADSDVQIKIAVDQLVCPSCQKWIVDNCISDLAALKCSSERKTELLVEVKSGGSNVIIGVTRNSPWSSKVGQRRHWPFS